MDRRAFLGAFGAGLVVATRLRAQDATTAQSSASNMVMDQGAVQPVRRPPKPGATPLLTTEQRDVLEHRIKCQCGCPLDVYTCRTTDFSCQVSPGMHRDVNALVAGGYSADEIIDAFVDTYGEKVLMAPKKQGFNWAGYIAPFAALGGGAVVVAALIRRWGARSAGATSPAVAAVHASPDELQRLDAALRNEDA